MPDIKYIRVTDPDLKPYREYSIPEGSQDASQKILDKPATDFDGTPLPPKFTPESLAKKDEGDSKK